MVVTMEVAELGGVDAVELVPVDVTKVDAIELVSWTSPSW